MQPPESPFDPPPNYAAGPPSGPEMGLYGAPSPLSYPPSSGPPVSTAVIGEAWQILQPNLGIWVGATVVYLVISFAYSFLQNMVQAAAMPGGFTATPGTTTPPNFAAMGPYFLISLLFGLGGLVLGQFLQAGLLRMAIQNVKTGRADIGEMFNVTDVLLTIIAAAILVGLIYFGGFLLCIIPGFIALCGLQMVIPLIVDQKVGTMDAIRMSWAALDGRKGDMFVLLLLLGLINLAGTLACCVGLLVTFPLTQISLAVVYRNLFLTNATAPAAPYYPSGPPIADPRGGM